TSGFLEEVESHSTGVSYPAITATDLVNLSITLPTVAEQEVIAAYLDDVTGKIDALISEKQKQVEDIRAYRTSLITETVTHGLNPDANLRPSGIDWLGDIPEHWKIVRLGLLFNAKAGGDAKPELYSSKKDLLHPFPVYTNSQVENQVYAYTSEAPFKSGSITVTGRGDIGRAFLRKEDFDAIIRLIVLFPINEVDCNYYKYFIDTVIPFLSDSAAVGQLSASQITNYLLAVPPLSEQQAIADFLDAKTAKIDELISELTKQIDELAEYKQAVITEAVTGKVDVCDYKPLI
ncbi:MAG: restriction endonuclease subunit S, partial [Muribaculaceae bacterium]|nr:restriction endonuclease subunit S [Muribaculaceae bacterium]